MRRLRAATAAWMLLYGSSAAAASRLHPLVQFEVDACVGVPVEEVRRVVAIELGPLLTDAGEPMPDRTRVDVGCRTSLVELRVNDPITGKSLLRLIDLKSAPQRAQPRLLALAVVELVSASWTELETNPEPKVPPAGPAVSPELRRAALETVRNHTALARRGPRLLAFASGLGFFSGVGLLAGGGLRFGFDHGHHLSWLVELAAHHADASTSLGTVSVDAVTAAALIAFHQGWSRFDLRLAGGVRLGAARLGGTPSSAQLARGESLWGALVGPMVRLGASAAPIRRLVFEIGLEAGYIVVPVGGLVAGQREIAVDGPWIGFDVGVGIFL